MSSSSQPFPSSTPTFPQPLIIEATESNSGDRIVIRDSHAEAHYDSEELNPKHLKIIKLVLEAHGNGTPYQNTAMFTGAQYNSGNTIEIIDSHTKCTYGTGRRTSIRPANSHSNPGNGYSSAGHRSAVRAGVRNSMPTSSNSPFQGRSHRLGSPENPGNGRRNTGHSFPVGSGAAQGVQRHGRTPSTSPISQTSSQYEGQEYSVENSQQKRKRSGWEEEIASDDDDQRVDVSAGKYYRRRPQTSSRSRGQGHRFWDSQTDHEVRHATPMHDDQYHGQGQDYHQGAHGIARATSESIDPHKSRSRRRGSNSQRQNSMKHGAPKMLWSSTC